MPSWVPWPNAFLLLLPVLLWNLALTPFLPESFPGDGGVPTWLLWAENVLRVIVFAGPVLLSFGWASPVERAGLVVYGAGSAVYVAAWLPHLLDVSWAGQPVVALAPYVTPVLVFAGVALASRSRWYGAAALVLVAVHAGHGWLAWGLVR